MSAKRAPVAIPQPKLKSSAIKFPITAAKKLAEEHNFDQVIVVGFRAGSGTVCTSYGKTLKDCEQVAIGANKVKAAIGFPPEMCNTVPARAKKAKKE
jgi:hypothetical protein